MRIGQFLVAYKGVFDLRNNADGLIMDDLLVISVLSCLLILFVEISISNLTKCLVMISRPLYFILINIEL